mmetsp:Transcript_30413/g.40448  ORF Transcript_30413/g.40448 Transcript_30413/m.40448 type:complete len:127 (+) Transcript_30413:649-1029(+)
MLFYRNDINQVYSSKRQITSMITSDASGAPNSNDVKVNSVLELKETFETLLETIKKANQSSNIIDLALNLMSIYSESPNRLVCTAVDYILPAIQFVVSGSQPSYQISRSKFNSILDCILYFLQMKE